MVQRWCRCRCRCSAVVQRCRGAEVQIIWGHVEVQMQRYRCRGTGAEVQGAECRYEVQISTCSHAEVQIWRC